MLLTFVVLFIIIVTKSPFMTEYRCKNYILDNKDKLIKEEKGLSITKTDFHYYTDITLRLLDDNRYQIIYWGDRNSWKWRFKLDKCIIIDVPYNKYKGKDVKLDLKILDLLR